MSGAAQRRALPRSVALARLFAAGHSLADSGGATAPDHGWFAKTAKLAGCTRFDSIAKGGAVLAVAEGDTIAASARYGGIGRLLQFAQTYAQQQAGSGNVYRTSAPYLPAFQTSMLMWGLNDLAWMGPTTFAAVYPIALTAAIQRIRAGAVLEDSDSSVAYTGGSWASSSLKTANSGQTVHTVTTNGQSLTITVPADFPGGTIALRFLTGPTGQGALWTVTGTGCAAAVNATYDTRNINGFDNGGSRGANGHYLNSVLRLTGLPAGAGTIVVTATTIGTTGYFDCWEIEAPVPPIVALPLHFRSSTYTPFATWPYQPVDADITTVNTAIAAAAAAFDSYVFTIATDAALNKQAAYFQNNSAGDTLHPNDLGHGLLALSTLPALRQAALNLGWAPVSESLLPDLRYWKLLDGSGDQAFQSSWTDYNLASYAPSGYFKDVITGRVFVRGHVAKTSGAANDVVLSLGVGYRPASTVQKPCVVFNGAAWQIGMLNISSTTGNLSINFNGSIAAGSTSVIDCDFLAEQ